MQIVKRSIRGVYTGILAACLVIVSCASETSAPAEAPLPMFSTIAILTHEDLVAISGAEPRGTKAVKGTTYGAAGGAAGGALYGAVMCIGPWWALCVGATSAIGLVAGAAGGAVLGFQGVSKEDSIYIMEELTHLNQQRNFQNELAEGVIGNIPPEMIAEPSIASAQGFTRITAVDFVEKNKNAVYMKCRATLVVVVKDENGDISEVAQDFVAFSDRYPIEEWLARGSSKFEAAANQCVEQLATEISALILQHRAAEPMVS